MYKDTYGKLGAEIYRTRKAIPLPLPIPPSPPGGIPLLGGSSQYSYAYVRVRWSLVCRRGPPPPRHPLFSQSWTPVRGQGRYFRGPRGRGTWVHSLLVSGTQGKYQGGARVGTGKGQGGSKAGCVVPQRPHAYAHEASRTRAGSCFAAHARARRVDARAPPNARPSNGGAPTYTSATEKLRYGPGYPAYASCSLSTGTPPHDPPLFT